MNNIPDVDVQCTVYDCFCGCTVHPQKQL